VQGGQQVWPQGALFAGDGYPTVATSVLQTTQLVWTFLARYTLPPAPTAPTARLMTGVACPHPRPLAQRAREAGSVILLLLAPDNRFA
jgi:hypothetical protein